MLPCISIRLNNLIKAMETVVAPALDQNQVFALEQSTLIVAHLKMLSNQWDAAYCFELGSLDNMVNLAIHLTHLTPHTEASQAALLALSATLKNPPSEPPPTVSAVTQRLREIGLKVDNFIDQVMQTESSTVKSQLTGIVLDYNQCQSARERVWFKDNHLDSGISDLSTFEEMLYGNHYRFKP
ncbi:hypothetical protein [Halioxenophilus aromaticivorans]|uniref:Uncharacterized protein n=1 Tax=Halioxenophilus aromaticivorans TaxID=1306992 RepID=A0AAV3U4G7_9ALTE